jgi:effector-binding domain-containing protein
MLDEPEILTTTRQLTAVIRLTIPHDEIREAMQPGITELMSTVAEQGIPTVGPWFNHHLRMDSEIFDFEISVPVAKPVVAVGRVRPSELPATWIARTVYRGPYEGLAEAWPQFDSWIVANGHTPGPSLWECYLSGAESGPDPMQWRTQFNRPLVAR